METQTNLKISIPKPCHEDWNKFTPDEKGAFCKVCSKSVHDFTKKTVEEISTILIDEMSAGKKVCGRFNEDQLTPVVETQDLSSPELSPYALNFTRIKKFALALFLVFGTYLFSTPKTYAQKMGKVAYIPRPEPIKGEVSPRYVEPKDTAKSDTTKTTAPKVTKCNTMKGDVMVEPIKLQTMGGVRAVQIEEHVVDTPVLGQAVIVEPVNSDTSSEIIESIMGDTVIEPMIMGLIAMPPDTEDMIITPLVLIDSTQQAIDEELAVAESTYVEEKTPAIKGEEVPNAELGEALALSSYPNPSSNGIITLRYNLKKDGLASISLFDLNGDLVKTLLPVQSMYASSYETKYDVSDLKDGIYFCELISGQNKTTTRIVISK